MIHAPVAMQQYRQFILWKWMFKQGTQQWEKVPINHKTQKAVNPYDPINQIDYQTATNMSQILECGINFVFTENDPFFFIDIDDAHQDNQWSQEAQKLCEVFNGCAVEVSYSGTGLHIFGSGLIPPHACRKNGSHIEFYTQLKTASLTGTNAVGDAAFTPAQNIIQWFVDSYFPPKENESMNPEDWQNSPVPEWSGPVDDFQLIDKMIKSKSIGAMFGNKASVQELWDADDQTLAGIFPPDKLGKYIYNHSSADQALCNHLAYWTGKDCERMDRMFRMSNLMRPKWLSHDGYYRKRTILNAVGICHHVLGHREVDQLPPVQEGVPTDGAPTYRSGGMQLKTVEQQQDHFNGCVYIRDINRVFTPDGGLLQPEQFKTMFGGYLFVMDPQGQKITKNAWEVFTQSQAINFPKAHQICFRPENKPGEVITEEGSPMVNTYVPLPVPCEKGDASRFVQHIAKILPNPKDQQILLCYMAACVQHVGTKFQWCVLLQGCEGNGKTLLVDCLTRATGTKYTHIANSHDIANKFNAWILGKVIVGVEEVHVRQKFEATEALKPLITNRRIGIEGKGANQETGDNRANFIMFTQHKDAIKKTKNDRRYAVFYTAQQTMADINRTGMGGKYFPSIYKWLREEGGHAIVTEFLLNYPIPDELNPAKLCHRAPITSSTKEVLLMSLGGLEQEVMNTVDEHRYGFCGGWLSSIAFKDLIVERKDEKRIPPNKRAQIINELGYIRHPGLSDGRVNSMIPKEKGKPVLYVKDDHKSLSLPNSSAIRSAYLKDQEASGV